MKFSLDKGREQRAANGSRAKRNRRGRRTQPREGGCSEDAKRCRRRSDGRREGRRAAIRKEKGNRLRMTPPRATILRDGAARRYRQPSNGMAGAGAGPALSDDMGTPCTRKKHALSALCPFSSRPSSRFFRPGDNGKRIARRTESGSGSRSQKHSMPAKPPEFRNNRQSLFLHDIDFKNFF